MQLLRFPTISNFINDSHHYKSQYMIDDSQLHTYDTHRQSQTRHTDNQTVNTRRIDRLRTWTDEATAFHLSQLDNNDRTSVSPIYKLGEAELEDV